MLIADTHLFLGELNKIYELEPAVKTAVMRVKTVPDRYYTRSELVWEPEYRQIFTDCYNGKLFLDFSGNAALHLACLMGFKEILLLGVDYTDGENKNWFPRCSTYDNLNTEGVSKNIKAIQEFYGVNIYQANPEAKTDLPIMSLEDFIDGSKKN